jgi:hypothetical protein
MPTERRYRVLAFELRLVGSGRNVAFVHRFLAPFEAEVGDGACTYELRREPREARPWAVYRDGDRLVRGNVVATILEFVLWDVSRNAIASAHGFFSVHAAVASWRGRGILLPAPADSGKSTLVAGLTRAGCAYLTDEAALIDPATAMVHPFPRSLWLERASIDAVFGPDPGALRWRTGRQFHVRPADLRPRSIGRPCPIRYVIAPAYTSGARTELVPISRAEALTALARQSFFLGRFGGDGVRLLGRVVGSAECYRVRVGDLDDAVEQILRMLAGSAPRDVEKSAVGAEPASPRRRT